MRRNAACAEFKAALSEYLEIKGQFFMQLAICWSIQPKFILPSLAGITFSEGTAEIYSFFCRLVSTERSFNKQLVKNQLLARVTEPDSKGACNLSYLLEYFRKHRCSQYHSVYKATAELLLTKYMQLGGRPQG